MTDRGPSNEKPAEGLDTVEPATICGWRPGMSVVGWDWASQAHDVTVLNDVGAVLDRWAFPHTEAGWVMALARLRRHGEPGDLPVIIEKTSGLIVDRLLAAGHPVVPVHPTAFMRPGRAGVPRVRSQTQVTVTSWRTTCAPTGTGCAAWNPPTRACGSCRPWCGCARTRSVPAPPPPTSYGQCSATTGPGPGICSAHWPRPSRWRS